jgi:methionyl-tRNA formyltransferase
MNTVPEWWRKPRSVSVVVDNDSWVLAYAARLAANLRANGDDAVLVRTYDDVREGDVAFYLGCVKIAPHHILVRNRRNLVVHASDLPRGRGFSPLVWLILEGAARIPVCLLDAADEADAGPVVYREWIVFDGHELNDELRGQLGEAHVALCERFMAEPQPPAGVPQSGKPTVYRRRTPADSRLDPGRSIAEQFDLLRVVDNERYPAFFDLRGHRYVLRIEKMSGGEGQW